jgi:ABC-2 type transport system ATP-binding protein
MSAKPRNLGATPFSIMNSKSEPHQGSPQLPAGKPVVEAVGLRKSFGSRLVLDGVSLTVRAGEVVGLLGPNGAGKTTTLSILATILEPDTGQVWIAGGAPRAAGVCDRLGFVPQAIALYPSLSALQNLELFARVHRIPKARARADAMRVLEEVGLAERAHDAVAVLSGGMKRRLNLACGMVHGPDLLMLDEPTVGVDPQSREKILLTVRHVAEAGGAIIYSTHYMEEVERLCDRVLLIDRGRVVAEGTVAEIVALGGRQPRMEISLHEELPADWYSGLGGVKELGAAGGNGKLTLQIASLAQVNELLERVRIAGGRVLEFSVHSPNLSDAFMVLTGHALRDPAGAPR